ncbi:MAG: PD40 domain-containing protein [Gammaproteobacteria bacterium]|nr:PD40 domain-containing protein [Gammaproteobacteria bacterium]
MMARLLLIPALALLASTQVQAAPADDSAWSVSAPPGDWRSIPIDTREFSWSDVDVSPDGRHLVFHMLGDIYRVGVEGGEAEALTDGIEWNFQPRYSPDGRHIAFISDRDGAENIWIMDADGSNPLQVSREREHLLHNPAWSPDGDYIAARKGYVSQRSIPAGAIWMYHRGGGGGVELVERLHGERSQKNIAEPNFSRDGRYVYFSQDITPDWVWQYNRDANTGIFAIRRLDRDTGEIDTVVSGPGGAIRPQVSPDGRQLAFIRRNAETLTSRLMLKDLESGIERALFDGLDRDKQETSGDMGNYPSYNWLPDGNALVIWAGGRFHRVGLDGEHQAIEVHVRTDKQVRAALRRTVKVDTERFDVRMLRWTQLSPDGRTAIYQALGHLWLHDLESDQRRRLTRQDDHWEFHPAFSPDGRYVVYTTFDDEALGSVRIAPVGRGRARVLTEAPGHYVEPAFSPDGSQVAFRKVTGGFLTSPTWSERPGLYRVDSDGRNLRRVLDRGTRPQFSADGTRLLHARPNARNHLALYSTDLEGRDEREHLAGEWITEYRVSPDGRWVAFTEHFNTYVAPFVSSGRPITLGAGSSAFPVRQVSARGGEVLHWSADSETLRWSYGAQLFERRLSDAFAFLAGAPETLPEPVTEGRDFGFSVASDQPEGRIALVGGRIVTMRDAYAREEIIDDGVILVEGRHIRAVGTADEVVIPEGYQVFDVTGKTVLPGLVDAHAHGPKSNHQLQPRQNWMQYAELAFGVTTVHDPSNDNWAFFSAAELQRSGQLLAPRMFSTGRILYGALLPGATARIDDYADAEFHVRRQRDHGAISVKSYNYLRRDQRQQVLAAGEALDILVLPEGGMRLEQNLSQIVDGHTGIEHSLTIQPIYEDILQLWSQTDVVYSPTFGVAFGGLMGEEYWYDRTEVWKNEKLMAFTPRSVVQPRAIRRPTAPDEHYNHIGVAEMAKALNDRGVPVVIGAHGQRAGLAAHWEIWIMVQGGFSPFAALRGATIDGARYFGMDADIGSIEVGKLADIIVIDGDPLSDIRDSEHVVYTMLNGRLYDSATMHQLAPQAVERQPFFFERQGGDAWQPATMEYFHQLGHVLGWHCRH